VAKNVGYSSGRSPYRQPGVVWVLNVLLAAAGVSAVGTLVLLYGGFSEDSLPVTLNTIAAVEGGIVIFFLLDRLLRLMLAWDRKGYLKTNWLDYVLMVLFLAAMVVAYQSHKKLVSAGALFLIITQVYMLAVLVLRAVGANLALAGSGLPPTWLLIGSFAALCLIGSGLLMLPAAVPGEFQTRWHYPDALFTATSATCVTGLIVVDTGTHFTRFGQAVILVMIQLGGLGIMIFGTILAILAGKSFSIRGSETVTELLATDRVGELGRIVRFVILFTLIAEAIGALLMLEMFLSPGVKDAWGRELSFSAAVWHAVFHSVSAFCNAGFALYPDNLMAGVYDGWSSPLRSHWQVLGVFGPLIVLGGLGFPVLQDLMRYLRRTAGQLVRRLRGVAAHEVGKPARLTLHSKIVLTSSALLIVLGAAGLMILAATAQDDPPNSIIYGRARYTQKDWEDMGLAEKSAAAVFQSITARTAGFNTVNMNQLSNANKLWLCVLMTIGGSPASTAGGMKTVTVALMVLVAWSILRRRQRVEAFGRTVSDVLLRRAITLVMLYLALVMLVTLLLSVGLPNENMIDLLFESCSACGTVGLSTGVTARLEMFEKIVVTAAMYLGRIGPLTLLTALAVGAKRANYSYPEEHVVIG
jgi:trk system potassium uptake protein TrkH